MKFVDSDISDLKSRIDYIELAEKDTEKKKKKKKKKIIKRVKINSKHL